MMIKSLDNMVFFLIYRHVSVGLICVLGEEFIGTQDIIDGEKNYSLFDF